ncbi:MAG TPA: hypothetical protein VHX12_09015, partial [Acidisoma sp.]|nr:hypothetical protein [Acidisoma sp.]
MSMHQTMQSEAIFDHWGGWLLHQRHVDDGGYAPVIDAKLARDADKILDAAGLRPGSRFLDLGAGDGLLAFRALDRMAGQLRVVMADTSPAIL